MTKKSENVTTGKVTKEFEIFDVVENENKFYIGMAGNLLTKKVFTSHEDAVNYIKSKPYDLIINATCLCMELSKKNFKNEKK